MYELSFASARLRYSPEAFLLAPNQAGVRCSGHLLSYRRVHYTSALVLQPSVVSLKESGIGTSIYMHHSL
jgi:hypothetical protein